MSPREAAGLAQDLWRLDVVDADRFATEKDDTFRLSCRSGRSVVVKVSHPGEHAEQVDFETALLHHVSQGPSPVPVPELLPSRHDTLLETVVDSAGQRRIARVMTCLDGTPLDSVGSDAKQREQVGEMLAHLRHATANFSHPQASRLYAWNVEILPYLEPLLGAVADPGHRARLASGLERFDEVVTPKLGGLRRQVLHNDFSTSNLLVEPADPAFVTGVLDFGDAVETAIAVDVSTAMLNQLPRDCGQNMPSDIFAAGRDVLRGYLRHAELTDEELAVIPHLVMGRVVARALITSYRARQVPGNTAYILRNTEQGWGQLEWFLRRSPDEIAATLTTTATADTEQTR
ncbi:phosphotransferase [Amycolatopsis acidicola]|uniref:Phosphotransferase n=2 Tax=Amycolatopsis acidicola TaxID=2596893 RepID=A0A5N0VCG5_9PSEU|nr:phosphotransferase [Amycolatopsis acidicola]